MHLRRPLAIHRSSIITCDLLELGTKTGSVFDDHLKFPHWNFHVRNGSSGCSLRKRKLVEELLWGLSASLREEEEHGQDLDDGPDAVRGVAFPCVPLRPIRLTNEVDESVEEVTLSGRS